MSMVNVTVDGINLDPILRLFGNKLVMQSVVCNLSNDFSFFSLVCFSIETSYYFFYPNT